MDPQVVLQSMLVLVAKSSPLMIMQVKMELLDLKTQVVQVQTTLAAAAVEMVKATILPGQLKQPAVMAVLALLSLLMRLDKYLKT